jgi:hypothetical protein
MTHDQYSILHMSSHTICTLRTIFHPTCATMRRLLLSQSQVSVVVSSSIVVLFTFLLFLSGYIIQQRTVSGLQQAIRPRIPKAPTALHVQQPGQDATPELQSGSRLFNGKARIASPHDEGSGNVNWKRLAHVQLARTHHDVCNCIMVLAELHKQRSPARRLLLFPREWALEKEGKKGDISDPFLGSSRRLLRMAARRYGVELRPMSAVVLGEEEFEGRGNVYSLASAFGMLEFDRVMSVETPGLLFDATQLDAILAFTDQTPFAMLEEDAEGHDGVKATDLLLLQPSSTTYDETITSLAAIPHFNDTLLPSRFHHPLLLSISSPHTEPETLIRSIGTLHTATDPFNQTAYLNQLAYLRFSDPKLPGPEYDVPWSQKVAARPRNKDADWMWTKMYGLFAQRRMEVCGLDLETWRGGD